MGRVCCCYSYSRLFPRKVHFGWNARPCSRCFHLCENVLPASSHARTVRGNLYKSLEIFRMLEALLTITGTLLSFFAPNNDSFQVNIPTTSRGRGLLCMWQQHEKILSSNPNSKRESVSEKRRKFLDVGLSLNLSFIKRGSALCVLRWRKKIFAKKEERKEDCVKELAQNSLSEKEVTIE